MSFDSTKIKRIGYFLLFLYALIIVFVVLLINNATLRQQTRDFVSVLLILSTFILPLSAFMFKSKIFRIVSVIPFIFMLILLVLKPHKIIGNSMLPNLQNGEYILENRFYYLFSKPKIGDVVIYDNGTKSIARVYKILENENYLLLGDKNPHLTEAVTSGKINIKNIKGKVLYKYWPNFEKVQDIEPNLIIVDKIKTIKANTTCYRYNTPVSKNSNGLGVIECSIITDNPIDVNKSYCESNLTKTKEYFHGFQQSNDYGYAATLNNVGLDDSAVLNIVDLNGNLVNCINKLQN